MRTITQCIVLMIALLGSDADAAGKTKKATNTSKTIRMLVTAYCGCEKCCSIYTIGETSIGDKASEEDGVAADPKLLKYRTKLRIPSVGVREVDDTGGAMRQHGRKGIYHIDVRFRDHKTALKFGRKWLDVEVLK